MKQECPKEITLYPQIDKVLLNISHRIKDALGDNLVGVCLFGSLTYGDFDSDRSDIDLVTLVRKPLTPDEVNKVFKIHKQIEIEHPQWQCRIENSFTPLTMLGSAQPPIQPRPYYNDGEIWDAQYGNEWINDSPRATFKSSASLFHSARGI